MRPQLRDRHASGTAGAVHSAVERSVAKTVTRISITQGRVASARVQSPAVSLAAPGISSTGSLIIFVNVDAGTIIPDVAHPSGGCCTLGQATFELIAHGHHEAAYSCDAQKRHG